MKSVYRVFLPEINQRNGRAYFVDFEVRCSSLDPLVSDLNDGDVIVGEKLFTRRTDDPNVWEVIDRQPFAISKTGVARIALPGCRFVEYSDDVVPTDAA